MDNSELRTLVKAIRDDPALSPGEKTKKIQDVMMAKSRAVSAAPKILPHNKEKSCTHYDKSCSQFMFSCCNVIDPCHRCHMARECCTVKPPQIDTIVCNECDTRQPPDSNCTHCGVKFSNSFCAKCRIWTSADIHHCEDCGFCRVGKADEIFHCPNCEACFSKETMGVHVCAKSKLKGEKCPLCLESVHSSQKCSSILKCGHVVHSDCWKSSVLRGDYRCPTCRKSLFNMENYWHEMRWNISLQPIPPNFFPIQVGDTVTSPMGSFLVHEIVTITVPAPKPVMPALHIAPRRATNSLFVRATRDGDSNIRMLTDDASESSSGSSSSSASPSEASTPVEPPHTPTNMMHVTPMITEEESTRSTPSLSIGSDTQSDTAESVHSTASGENSQTGRRLRLRGNTEDVTERENRAIQEATAGIAIPIVRTDSSNTTTNQPADANARVVNMFEAAARRRTRNGASSATSEIEHVKLYKGELTFWTMANKKNATATFREASLVKENPSVTSYCYDCETKSSSPFHFFGLECKDCLGFNTTRV